MKEYSEDNLNALHLDQKYINTLYVSGFSQMMSNPSYCYKFYWLEAIVRLITRGIQSTVFDVVINEMIQNAWYSVLEYHIHLSGLRADGQVRDGLERAVLLLKKCSDLPSDASRDQISEAIEKYNDQLKPYKEQLTNLVPYRALSGFFTHAGIHPEWKSARRLTQQILEVNNSGLTLPYTLGDGSKLNKEICFSPDWVKMIQDNAVNILGWIQYEKVRWLQNNNPEVPGIVYKLAPADEKVRHLAHARKLWNAVMSTVEIQDIYTGKNITSQFELDHFIPWSFVMNDELWDLMPVNPSINSSKSNHLPEWKPFFQNFAENQYLMYQMIYQSDAVHKLFDSCYRDNLHSIWAARELYRPGNSRQEFFNIMEKNVHPVYDSAYRQGYDIWNFH